MTGLGSMAAIALAGLVTTVATAAGSVDPPRSSAWLWPTHVK